MAGVRVDEQGVVSLSKTAIAVVTGLLTLITMVTTIVATMLSRESNFASRADTKALHTADSVMLRRVTEIASDHTSLQLLVNERLLSLRAQVDRNAQEIEMIKNRQNWVICRLAGSNSDACRDATNGLGVGPRR